MKIRVNMCPDCCCYPECTPIEDTGNFKVGCGCGLSCIGKGKIGAYDCWNSQIALKHPVSENFEPMDLEVEE